MKTRHRIRQFQQAVRGSAARMIRCRQIVLMLLIPLSCAHVNALSAMPGDDKTGTEQAMTFETLSIHRPTVVWFGKVKSHIGNYAVVTRKCNSGTVHDFTSDYKFSLDVAPLKGAAIKLNGKIHTDYRPINDEPEFMQAFAGYYIEKRTGISNVEVTYDAYKSTFTATIVTGNSPGETWQFMADKRWKAGKMLPETSGTLTNGARTLHITSRSDEPSFDPYGKIYEDGELLSRRISDHEYVFRAGIRPELKLLLLTGMEILAITERGECR